MAQPPTDLKSVKILKCCALTHAGSYRGKHTYQYSDHTAGHISAQPKSRKLCRRNHAQSLHHGPGQDQIYKQWLDSDCILPGGIRYFLTREGVVKICQRKGMMQNSLSDLLISQSFTWKNDSMDETSMDSCSGESPVVFLYAEDLLQ